MYIILGLLVAILFLSLAYRYLKARGLGIIFILLGLGTLIGSILFSSGYDPVIGFLGSVPRMEVVLKEGTPVNPDWWKDLSPPGAGPIYLDRIAFPLKYSLILSVFLILVGSGIILIDSKRPIS